MPYIENEILERLITTMVEGFARVEKKLDHMNRLKECLDGDKFLDNVDLAELLGVSQRTLARYREKGIIRCTLPPRYGTSSDRKEKKRYEAVRAYVSEARIRLCRILLHTVRSETDRLFPVLCPFRLKVSVSVGREKEPYYYSTSA